MKTFLNICLLFLCSIMISSFESFSQAPQAFKYQTIARNSSGLVLSNQNVGFKVSLIQGTATGSVIYSEEHNATTNTFGLVNLEIGNGTNPTSVFVDINWAAGPYYIKIEFDANGGTVYADMGTTQLLSVPYALFAASGNQGATGATGPTGLQGSIGLTGVTGTTGVQGLIGLTGATGADGALTAWSKTGNAGTNVATNFIGTTDANDFVMKTNNSEKMRITSAGNIGIGTTNPLTALHVNGTLSITDDTEGTGKIFTSDANGTGSWQTPVAPAIGSSIGTANYIPKFISSNAIDNSLIYQNGNRLGVGTINPSGRLMIQADTSALATEPLFEIKDKAGKTVMVVYEDSVHFFVKDDTSGAKTNNRGSFAVSGKSNSKSLTNDFLRINADSTRIYTTDTTKGFGVQNLIGANKSSYLQLTPGNYFIGHESGKSITSGKYNSFIGYQSGYKNNTGKKNYFIGYRSGYNNSSGYSNIFIGDSTGFTNTTGNYNIFIGNESGLNNSIGFSNVFAGTKSGFSNISGIRNVFIGDNAGYLNTSGNYNVFLGYHSGYSNNADNNSFIGYYAGVSNTDGANNVFIGKYSGNSNTTGNNNVFLGYYSGYTNNASFNTFLGYYSGRSNSSGSSNSFIGYYSGRYNTTGSNNAFIGNNAGKNNSSGSSNVFIGDSTGCSNISGNFNVFLGKEAGYANKTSYNVFVGFESGRNNITGANNTFLGYLTGRNNTTGKSNLFVGDSAGFSNISGNCNVFLGKEAGYANTASYNVFIGFESGRSNLSGYQNAFIGYQAGKNNTLGWSNVFIGRETGYSNINGNDNVFLGYKSGNKNTSGNENAFVGVGSGELNTTGYNNTCIGRSAGYNNTVGIKNVYLGYSAGGNSIGSSNVFIGYQAGNNELGNNKLYIANSDVNPPLIYGDFSSNRIGLGTLNPNSTLHINASPTDDGLRVQINGSTKLFVDNGGGVSVGSVTIPPANGLYVSGNVGFGIDPGNHQVYATSSSTTTTGSTGFFVNTAAAGIAMSLENSSTTSSDAVLLVSQKGSAGDIAAFDSWHGTGSWDREFRFTNTGNGLCDGSWTGGGADYAEYFIKADITKNYEPGDVILMSSAGHTVETTNETYSNRVVGVFSTNPVVIGNGSSDGAPANSVLVGMMGVIPTKVSTENGEIKVGDFLTNSSKPGVAMKATKPCVIIGRSMENYDKLTVAKIKVLVNPGWAGNEEMIKEQNAILKQLENDNTQLKIKVQSIDKLKAEIDKINAMIGTVKK